MFDPLFRKNSNGSSLVSFLYLLDWGYAIAYAEHSYHAYLTIWSTNEHGKRVWGTLIGQEREIFGFGWRWVTPGRLGMGFLCLGNPPRFAFSSADGARVFVASAALVWWAVRPLGRRVVSSSPPGGPDDPRPLMGFSSTTLGVATAGKNAKQSDFHQCYDLYQL